MAFVLAMHSCFLSGLQNSVLFQPCHASSLPNSAG